MTISLIIDLVLICIAIGIVVRSWKQGLVSSVVRLVGAIASYAGAWIMSKPLATMLYNGLVRERLVDYAEGLVPPDLQKMADGFSAIGGDTKLLESLGMGNIGEMVAKWINTVLQGLGLDSLPFDLVDSDKVGNEIAGKVLDKGMSIAEALTDSLLQPLAMTVLRIVCFALVFAVLTMVVSFVYRIGFGFNHIPLVGGVNHLLGAGVGLLEACIVIYIICAVITIASAMLGGRFELLRWDNLGSSRLLSFVAGLGSPAGMGIL